MTSPATESVPDPAPAQETGTALLSLDDFSQYLLHTRSEMFTVFRGLVEHVTQLTMIFNEGRDMVLTSLMRYGDSGLVFDFGASAEMNRKALEADKLFCAAQLEKVKIQFILRGVKRIEADGRPAFLAPLPDSLLRLQRREYYRLQTPITRPLKCTIDFPVVGGSTHRVESHVADISGGGVCLTGLPSHLPLEKDMELPGCNIGLPEVGLIAAALRLRSVEEITSRSGTRSKRAGCEFIKLSGPMATLIQRYIIKTERERKARESGMA
jgi:c-di-GMP-binding flagellar brake protein YcgR